MKRWEKDFSIQSEVLTLAFMCPVGFNHSWRQLLWAIGFPFAKTFGGVRTKPEQLPMLPRRVVGWVSICITFAWTSLNQFQTLKVALMQGWL